MRLRLVVTGTRCQVVERAPGPRRATRGRLRLGESERRRGPRRSLVGAYIRSGHVRANVARPNEGVASLHQRREAPKPSSTTPSAVTQMISAPQIATVRKGLNSGRLKAEEINCNKRGKRDAGRGSHRQGSSAERPENPAVAPRPCCRPTLVRLSSSQVAANASTRTSICRFRAWRTPFASSYSNHVPMAPPSPASAAERTVGQCPNCSRNIRSSREWPGSCSKMREVS